MCNQMTLKQVDSFFEEITETAMRNGLSRQLEDWYWCDNIQGFGFIHIGIRGDKAVGCRSEYMEYEV